MKVCRVLPNLISFMPFSGDQKCYLTFSRCQMLHNVSYM